MPTFLKHLQQFLFQLNIQVHSPISPRRQPVFASSTTFLASVACFMGNYIFHLKSLFTIIEAFEMPDLLIAVNVDLHQNRSFLS